MKHFHELIKREISDRELSEYFNRIYKNPKQEILSTIEYDEEHSWIDIRIYNARNGKYIDSYIIYLPRDISNVSATRNKAFEVVKALRDYRKMIIGV